MAYLHVVGGTSNSGKTARLVEMALKSDRPVYWIEQYGHPRPFELMGKVGRSPIKVMHADTLSELITSVSFNDPVTLIIDDLDRFIESKNEPHYVAVHRAMQYLKGLPENIKILVSWPVRRMQGKIVIAEGWVIEEFANDLEIVDQKEAVRSK